MHNWSTDEQQLKKKPNQYAIWRLEQLINFGLDGEKICQKDLKRHWDQLIIDPSRKKFLELLLNE